MGTLKPDRAADQLLTAPKLRPVISGGAGWLLGTTLIYVRGRPGDEMFLALPNVKGSALSDRKDGLYLQFRHGRLTGWKGDWGSNRPCCN